MSQLLTILQTVGILITPVITLTGFILLYRQIKAGANAALYNEQNVIHQFFLANPGISPYFYGKKSIAPSSEDYVKVMLAAEMLGDFFEHIYLQKANLPRKIWPGWRNYMNYLYEHSPALQLHFSENRKWYGQKFIGILKYSDSQ